MSVAPPTPTQAPPDPPELPSGATPTSVAPPWRWWHGIVAFLAWFAGVNIVGVVIILAVAGVDGASDPPPGATIAATVVQDVLLIGAAVLVARLVAGTANPWQFGLRPTRPLRALGWVAVTYVTFLVATAAYTAAFHINAKDELPTELGVDKSDLAKIAVAILVTVIAPVAEEFFFRGFLFPALRGSFGLWPAAILTGVIFGGVHAGSSPAEFLPPLMVLGFALCLLYQQTGSLYPCIAVHCVNNSIAFGAGVHWPVWGVLALMVGALATITLALVAVRRLAGPPPPRLATT